MSRDRDRGVAMVNEVMDALDGDTVFGQRWGSGEPIRIPPKDQSALTGLDFANGRLAHASHVRPGKLFTAHADLMEQIVGMVKPDFLEKAREAVIQVIRGGLLGLGYGN